MIHNLKILLFFSFTFLFSDADNREYPDRFLVGYWHNFINGAGPLLLSEIPDEFDVINISFAEPDSPFGSNISFSPDLSIYPNPDDFQNDIISLQNEGRKILISIGGANGPIHLNNETDIQQFVNSMMSLISQYNFDGLDIDLEGQSLYLNPGDTDFRNPTSPTIVNFIEAIIPLTDQLPDDFILSAAPETAHVQGGASYYGTVWGVYLPVIHALRDRLSHLHVQHYNTGSMLAIDGNSYQPATADFHVAMAEMLLTGFTVSGGLFFEALDENQVMFGLPAGPSAAGSGYTNPETLLSALDYLIHGIPFGGSYNLNNQNGYPEFPGLMTWSINWDDYYGNEFSTIYGNYFDELGELNCEATGDVNDDGELNILDIVNLVNFILDNNIELELEACADCNSDSEINILDVICMVNILISV